MVTCRICKERVEKYANGTRCRECYNAYMRDYMLKRYHRRRVESPALLGGKCVDCSSTEDLHFDHVDRSAKSFDLGGRWSFSDSRIQAELSKCVLRCRSCHQLKTSREQSVEHGGGVSGKKNCFCGKCKPLKQQYQKRYLKDQRVVGEIGYHC